MEQWAMTPPSKSQANMQTMPTNLHALKHALKHIRTYSFPQNGWGNSPIL